MGHSKPYHRSAACCMFDIWRRDKSCWTLNNSCYFILQHYSWRTNGHATQVQRANGKFALIWLTCLNPVLSLMCLLVKQICYSMSLPRAQRLRRTCLMGATVAVSLHSPAKSSIAWWSGICATQRKWFRPTGSHLKCWLSSRRGGTILQLWGHLWSGTSPRHGHSAFRP